MQIGSEGNFSPYPQTFSHATTLSTDWHTHPQLWLGLCFLYNFGCLNGSCTRFLYSVMVWAVFFLCGKEKDGQPCCTCYPLAGSNGFSFKCGFSCQSVNSNSLHLPNKIVKFSSYFFLEVFLKFFFLRIYFCFSFFFAAEAVSPVGNAK